MAGNNQHSNDGFWESSIGLNFEPSGARLTATSTEENPQTTHILSGDNYQDGSHHHSNPGQHQFPSTTEHNCPGNWCGPASALEITRGGSNGMGGPKSSSLRPSINTVPNSSTWDKSSAYDDLGLAYPKKANISENAEDNDDAKSDCSSCPGTCPSHCGESGHGSICCDAEECEDDICTEGCDAQDTCVDHCPGSEPCVDQDCEGASDPCTDEACIGPTPEQPPRRAEAAAAQALTSFFENEEAGAFNGDLDFLNDFNFDGDQAYLGGNGGGGMNFGAGNNHFNDFGMNMHNISHQGTYTQGQSSAASGFDFGPELWNHIRQYHDPEHQGHDHTRHMRPCMADHPALIGHTCPLPNLDGGQCDFTFMGQESDCNYTIPDVGAFASHVVSNHEPLLQHIPGWSSSMPEPNFSNLLGEPHGCNSLFNGQFQGGNSFQNPGIMATPSTGYTQAHQHPTPGSVVTVPSLRNTPLPTPDSAMTSPSADTSQRAGDHGALPPQFKIETPHLVKGLSEPKPQGRSMGPDDAFRCYWQDDKTGQPCLHNFANSDELDAHCKSVHTKDLSKKGVGFQCSWQGCKRQNDSFTTRAKLNRHLQTHTGFKPMECPHCGLRLSAKQALDQHIRTHTGEHPYKCKYGCGRTFKQHSALTMHHRVHTKEKPLICAVCSAKFTESSNLSKHMRTHSVKGHFDCELCEKNFHRLDQLRRHLYSNHKDQPEAVVGNIERAKDWKKKANREKRGNMRASSASSSVEPPTGSSDMNIEDEPACDDKDTIMSNA